MWNWWNCWHDEIFSHYQWMWQWMMKWRHFTWHFDSQQINCRSHLRYNKKDSPASMHVRPTTVSDEQPLHIHTHSTCNNSRWFSGERVEYTIMHLKNIVDLYNHNTGWLYKKLSYRRGTARRIYVSWNPVNCCKTVWKITFEKNWRRGIYILSKIHAKFPEVW